MTEDQAFPVKAETLRLWLKAAGIWQRRRQRKQYHQRRNRRPRIGDLVQMDGSTHAWFSENSEKQCLMNRVDDATGTTESFLDSGETTFAAFTLMERWVKKYGVPAAVYVDLQSILCWDTTRTVRNDWTAQLDNQHYQLEKKQPVNVQPGQKIMFKRHLNGQITLWYHDQRLAFHLIAARPVKAEKPKLPDYSTEQRCLPDPQPSPGGRGYSTTFVTLLKGRVVCVLSSRSSPILSPLEPSAKTL
jgi:hypothetical protein